MVVASTFIWWAHLDVSIPRGAHLQHFLGAAGKDHSLAVLDLSCHAVLHSDAFILDSATGEADLQDFGLWRLYACAVIALLV